MDEITAKNHGQWTKVANEHWLGKSTKKRKTTFLKEHVWHVLERDDFQYASLQALENLQLLEYLWSTYTDDTTHYHVLTLALLVTVRIREGLPTWQIFQSNATSFAKFFRSVLTSSLDISLNIKVRTSLICFVTGAFQSLENPLVRKECAALVSIATWHNLHSDTAREERWQDNAPIKKAWRASTKRYEAADEVGKASLRFERSWIYNLLLDLFARLQDNRSDDVPFCERVLELLTDLESQLPTRRYINSLLQDMNVLAFVRFSSMFNTSENGLLRDLFVLLRHFAYFPIHDYSGEGMSADYAYDMTCQSLSKLQRVAMKYFKDKLKLLMLSNFGALQSHDEVRGHLKPLTELELHQLCTYLNIRTQYPSSINVPSQHDLLLEILSTIYEKRISFQEATSSVSVAPTETAIYESSLLRNENYDGSKPLGIPKLNLQYLTPSDFLWRSFVLYRCEQFFEIRTFLEETMKRLQCTEYDSIREATFSGFSKMALPISKPAILEAAPAKIGSTEPAFVKAEIILDVTRLSDTIRREWESLKPQDSIFLLAVRPGSDSQSQTNGHVAPSRMQQVGMAALRVAEVVQILDQDGRSLRGASHTTMNGNGPRPQSRRLLVNLDARAYHSDMQEKERGLPDIYDTINVVVRRDKRENNFRKVLETIQRLAVSDTPIPSWLQEVFLGFGNPKSANYTQLVDRLESVDVRDSILDWAHLQESFPAATIRTLIDDDKAGFGPPYVLRINESETTTESAPSRKRRRIETTEPQVSRSEKVITVSTYSIPLSGPYPQDTPKKNVLRFTPKQVEAIISGTQPGLTVIVGPPGTGKTDVATQIISNIYHNFPHQRTLLVARSNQALNQLFQKITRLDIDGRHLLRLGQGEGDLETEESFSKTGRVESFLENRAQYLSEVDRLAANCKAPGAHGSTCETAAYFDTVYIRPAWSRFWDTANASESNAKQIIDSFPFKEYFRSAPRPLFPPDSSHAAITEIAKGCERHIKKIFAELEDIRPFEVLRNNKDRTNYLMIKEARIIAMTSTHAAMRRQEIADLGFRYDTVIMEEAAQITEVENFIPLALQDTKGGRVLQRIVLCGDHLQNSPIVSNSAFRQFANLEQSLFLRLVRLGVPTIELNAQGRARPSIAELYRWRYPWLENLPSVRAEPAYLHGNAGFRYEYQFIDVPDYKGKGESQPSPHFLQNLGEAEYAVAIYQYMRLLGYPASKISILTTYAGQRALIRDVLLHRCAGNRLFDMPRIVTTVDKYQGEQNEYIILSLVRTSRPGYLRDLRRLTVALSRAKLGLYILGRRDVFESVQELHQAFALMLERPAKLLLTTGEMYPTERMLDGEIESSEMVSVEHIGQYVYEMTQAKVQMLKEGSTTLPPQEPGQILDQDAEEAPPGVMEDDAGADVDAAQMTSERYQKDTPDV